MEKKGALQKERAEMMERSTAVPASFEEAVALAAESAAAAREESIVPQVMFMRLQGDDEESRASEALEFSEQLAQALVAAGQGATVRLVLDGPDMVAQCTSHWRPPPPGIVLDTMPPLTAEGTVDPQVLGAASYVLLVAPSREHLPATRAILRMAMARAEEGSQKTAVVLVNPPIAPDGLGILTSTFHMEQLDLEDAEGRPLNSAVVARVWPRDFTAWEDNPDDPESVDGYYMLTVRDDRPWLPQEVNRLLQISRLEFRERAKFKGR